MRKRPKSVTGGHAATARHRARISLVLPKDMTDDIERLAKTERRSMNKQCEVLLGRALGRSDVALAS